MTSRPAAKSAEENILTHGDSTPAPDVNAPKDRAARQFRLINLAVRYPGADSSVIEGLTLDIVSGELLAIVGPSGCGKSTILKVLAGLLQPASGCVQCSQPANPEGEVSSQTTQYSNSRNRRTGFVFQNPTLLPWRTALDNLMLPGELGTTARSIRSVDSSPAHSFGLTTEKAMALMEKVGLDASDAAKRPRELSGGMQMRLSLARALAVQPSVLLLDEPFSAVDDLLRLQLQDDVRRLHEQQGLTTILVTHNLHEAVYLGDRVAVLDGKPATISGLVEVKPSGVRTTSFRESSEFYDCVRNVSTLLFRRRSVSRTADATGETPTPGSSNHCSEGPTE